MELQNKKAVITGGSRGIGKAIAAKFLSEGAAVVLIARSEKELAEVKEALSTLGEVHTLALDVRDKNAMQRAAKEVGAIDILVNAAGIYGPIGRITEIDPEEWKQAVEVNLYGVFLSIHFFAPLMKGGSIINFVGGGEGAYPHFTSYVSAKGGIARLTETVAKELPHIRVNAIAPGPVNTRFLDELIAAGPEKAGKENYARALAQQESGGVSPDAAAALSVFLASDKASITGKVLSPAWDEYEKFSERTDGLQTDVYTMRRVRPGWLGLDWDEPKD
jgi:NAD(P)-dependent dehydrogenase (short-subunit alcohol dehydrogenase family)